MMHSVQNQVPGLVLVGKVWIRNQIEGYRYKIHLNYHRNLTGKKDLNYSPYEDGKNQNILNHCDERRRLRRGAIAADQ
jgi:hypothetical protein